MAYKTCPDCGERVYSLGCTNCNEGAYISEQASLDADWDAHPRRYDMKRPDAEDEE